MRRQGQVVWVSVWCMLFLRVSVLGGTPDARSMRYFELLLRQPGSEAVYDRFYDAWLDSGTLEGLETFLNDHLAEQPGTNARLLLATFYERQNQDDQALTLYAEAAHDAPEDAEILYLKAKAESRLLLDDQAIEDLKKAQALDMEDDLRIEIGQYLGRLYVRTGHNDLARETWAQLLAAFPDDEDLYEDLIELQLTEGLYEQALATCDTLLAKTVDPYQRVMRRLRKGDIYLYSAKDDEALRVYAETLAMVGQGTWLETQICFQIDQVYRRKDDLTGLRDFVAQMSQADPQRLALKKRLAGLHLALGDTEEALSLYRDILKVTPGDTANQRAYVDALVKSNRLADAVTLMQQLVVQRPLDRDLLIQLADLQHQNKQPNEVTESLTRFLTLTDDPSEFVYLRIARLMERYGLTDEALAVYQEMIGRFPESLSAKEAYAAVLHRHDQKDEAMALWSEIARTGDLPTLLRVTQIVGSHGYRAQAYRWFVAQYATYKDNLSYHNRLCDIAIHQKDYDRAFAWAQTQLALSDTFTQMQNAIQQILTITQQLDNQDACLAMLEARTARSVGQTCLQVELLERAYRPDQADLALAQAPQDDARIALQAIRLYRHRKQWKLAAESLEQLVADGGRSGLHIRDLVQLYNRSGQHEKALSWIPGWKKASPGSVDPWLEQARLLALLGRHTEAINALRKADQTFDGDTRVLTQLASHYQQAQRIGDAQRVYWRLFEQAKELTAKMRWVRDMGYASRQAGAQKQLMEKFLARKQSNPNSVVPCLALAELYRQTDQYEQRRQVLIEATRIRSDDVSLLHEVARIEESEGDWKRALDTLAMAAGLDETDKSRQKMAQLHLQYGNEEDGYRILFELASARTMLPGEAMATAETIMMGQNWSMAVEFLQDVIPQHSENYKLQYLYAVALEEDGQEQKALEQFVNLLDLKTELPGNVTQSRLQSWAGTSGIDQILSEESIELMQYQQFLSLAYQYRQRSGRTMYRYSSLSYGGTGPKFQIPETVLDAPHYAWAHLLTLADNLDDETQDRVQRLLDSVGVANRDVLSYVTTMPAGNFYAALPRMTEVFPENPAVLELAAFYSVQGHAMEPEQVTRLFDRFRETRPHLAALMGLAYGTREEAMRDLIEPSLEILQSIDQPTTYEFSLLCNVLQNPDLSVTQAHVAVLSDLVKAWYPLMAQPSPRLQAMAGQAALVLGGLGDVHGCLTLMDQEIRRLAKGSHMTSPFAQAYPGQQGAFIQRNSGTLIQPLTFPGSALPGYPVTIVQMLLPMDSGYVPRGRLALDPNHLETYLDVVQDPMLEVLVCLNVQDQDRARALLDPMVAEESSSVAACYLLALLETQQDNTVRAVSLLERVRNDVKFAQDKETVDGAIVHYVQAMVPDEDPDAKTRAQRAAKRLARRPLNDQQKRELVRAMEQLGLEKDAEQLSQRGIQHTSTQARYFQPGRQSLSSSDVSRIQELFEEKKSKAALQQAFRSLKAEAAQSLMPDNARIRSRTTQLSELLKAHKVQDRVLEMAHPGQSGNLRRWLEYGRLCQLLDQPDKAKEAYETILVKRPRDYAARIWSVLLNAADDPNQAIVHLELVDPRYADQTGQQLSNYVQQNYHRDGGLNLVLNTGRMAILYLDHLEDPNEHNVQWVASLIQMLSQAYHRDNLRLGSIYQKTSLQSGINSVNSVLAGSVGGMTLPVRSLSRRGGATVSGSAKAPSPSGQDQARRDIHNQLCRRLIRIPQVASHGFSGLLAEAMARNDVTEEFEALARRALLGRPSKRAKMRSAYAHVTYSYQYSWGNDLDSRYISPLEYLVRTFWKQGQLASRVDTLHGQLEQRALRDEASLLRLFEGLYLCEAAQYEASAQAFLSNRTMKARGQTAVLYVLDIWRQRDLSIDLNSLVLAQVKTSIERDGRSVQGSVDLYVRELVKRSPDQARAFLDDVVTLYLGPKAKRQALIDTHYDRRRVSGRTINSRIHACFNLLRQMAQQEALLFAVLDSVQGLDLPAIDLRYAVRQVVENKVNRARETQEVLELMAFIQASPFLGDPSVFRPLAVPQMERNTVFSLMVYRLRQVARNGPRGDTQDNLMLTALKSSLSSEKASFGRDVLLAFLEKDDVHQSVYTCLANHLKAIAVLPEDRQRDVSLLVMDILEAEASDMAAWPETARAAHGWAMEIRSELGRDKVTRFLNTKRFEDLSVDGYQFDEYVADLVNAVVAYDLDSAHKILVKANSLKETALSRGTWRYSISESLTSSILRRMTQNSNQPNLNVLGLIVHLVRDQDQPDVMINPSTISQIGSQLSQLYRQASRGHNDESLAGFQKVFLALRQVVGPGNVSGFSGAFRRVLDRAGIQDIDAILAWLKTQAPTDPCPGLNAEFQALLKDRKLRHLGGPRNAEQDDIHGPLMGDFYLQVLDNNDLSVQWRLLAYVGLMESNPDKVELCTVAAARLLDQAWSIYPELPTHFPSAVLSRFLNIKDRPSEWTDMAGRLCQTYAVMRQKRPSQSGVSSRYQNASDIQLAVMELNLILGQEDVVTQMHQGYDTMLGQYVDAWALAVQYNQGPLLGMMVNKHWKQKTQMGRYRRVPEGTTHLASCLESIATPDLRYYAELAVTRLNTRNGSSRGRGQEAPPENPMVALARRFKDVSFSSSELKQKALLELIETPEALGLIAEPLTEEAQNLDWRVLVNQQSRSGRQVHTKILAAYGQSRLLEGDPNAFVGAIEAIAAGTPANRPYEGSRLIGEIWRSVSTPLERNSELFQLDSDESGLKMARLDALSQVSRAVLQFSDMRFGNVDFRQLVSFHIILSVLAGRGDALTEDMAGLGAEFSQAYLNGLDIASLQRSLRSFVSEKTPLEKRLGIYKDLLKVQWVKAMLDKRPGTNRSSQWVGHRLLTQEEVDSHKAALESMGIEVDGGRGGRTRTIMLPGGRGPAFPPTGSRGGGR